MPPDQGTPSIIGIAATVGAALRSAGADYFLGGSVASSFHGEFRATNDIDLVTDLRTAQVPAFAAALGPDFDIDQAALADAIRQQSSWNIFFLPEMLKIDLFALGSTAFDQSEFARRATFKVGDSELVIKSPEDTILRKLLWFREGGGVSDQQWRDIHGVLRLNAPTLDNAYLDSWAASLGLTDILSSARLQARTHRRE